MTELRKQMRNMLLAAARDPDNREIYLWCWDCLYKVRKANEWYDKLLWGSPHIGTK